MKVFVLPRLLAAKIAMYFGPRAADGNVTQEPSFWILHAR